MVGREAGWGWTAHLSGAGQAGLEPQIILEIASCSVCNQDQTGSGWWGGGGSHCQFLSSKPLRLPTEWDDIREGDGGNVPPPHPLLNNSFSCLGSLAEATPLSLMEPMVTSTHDLNTRTMHRHRA